MAKLTSKPTRHQRTRKDHSTETAEDYVEAVAELIDTKSQCRLVDLAKYFGVSHVTANRIVARLAKEGLLQTEPYKPIELTRTGRRLAKSCQERHEIVRSFLIALGLDSATADIDSEGIEHHVSPKTVELFQRFVDRLSANPDC
jgi:DtxR family manganese transport transcriptional regulator